MVQLIIDAANEFERLYNVHVSDDARQALIAPALEHRAEIEQEVKDGTLNKNALYGKIIEQLSVAYKIAQEREPGLGDSALTTRSSRIDLQDAVESMARHCAVLFWC